MSLLKERLKKGDRLFGTFVNLCHPAVLEIAGLAGFDFAIIDTEHGELSSDRAVDMVRAAKLAVAAGMLPVTMKTRAAISSAQPEKKPKNFPNTAVVH